MEDSNNYLMVTLWGQDRPGITASFTRILTAHAAEVVDIGQASLRNFFGQYLLLDLNHLSASEDSLIKDLLFNASRLDLTLHFTHVSTEQVGLFAYSNLYVFTHFGDTRALAEFSIILKEENVNIEMITCPKHHGVRSIEMVMDVSGAPSLDRLKQRLMLKGRELQVDLALQKMEAYRKNKRLVFFDMDSTLIDMEIIDEMARRAGVYREVSRITEKAMRGDFDFEVALVERVALLKGLRISDLIEIRDSIRLSEGVEELTTTLKWLGYKLGVVTGGFNFFAQHIKERLGLDFAFANSLEIKDASLTGRVVGKVIDGAEKARIVNQTACDQGILLDQTVVVGDGANDALMLAQAGLGIAYNAKEALQGVANVSLGRSRMKNIFHLLGIAEVDIEEAVSCKGAWGQI